MLMTIKSNSGLIPASDFYNDQTPVSTSSDGFDDCDNSHSGDLPKSITNIRGDPSTVYQSYRVSNCQFCLCMHVKNVISLSLKSVKHNDDPPVHNYFLYCRILKMDNFP